MVGPVACVVLEKGRAKGRRSTCFMRISDASSSEEPDAETECESAINQALEWAPNGLEAELCLANLRLCQCRADEAVDIVRRCLSRWRMDAAPDDDDSDAVAEQGVGTGVFSSDDPSDWPTYSQQVAVAKLCIELSLYEEALSVLEILLATDDEDPEPWYLIGWTYYLTRDTSLAVEHLVKASEVSALEWILSLHSTDRGCDSSTATRRPTPSFERARLMRWCLLVADEDRRSLRPDYVIARRGVAE
jgi:hypothetical protein